MINKISCCFRAYIEWWTEVENNIMWVSSSSNSSTEDKSNVCMIFMWLRKDFRMIFIWILKILHLNSTFFMWKIWNLIFRMKFWDYRKCKIIRILFIVLQHRYMYNDLWTTIYARWWSCMLPKIYKNWTVSSRWIKAHRKICELR